MSQLESFRVLLVDDDVRLLESMETIFAERFLLDRVPFAAREMRGKPRKPFRPRQWVARVKPFARVAQAKCSNAALAAAPQGEST